jgi:RNA polymerase sigma-70 factor, ECF subfamily
VAASGHRLVRTAAANTWLFSGIYSSVGGNDSLVARAVAGDRAAAGEVVRLAWPDAYRLAWSILRDRTAAEDAAQEACARAWSAISGLRSPERFAVWFYRIVVNECKRAKRVLLRAIATGAPAASHDELAPEERIDVRRAIDALDPRLRLAVLLRYYYQLNSTEIAEVIGASPVTVRWRLMLAHRRLAGLLEDPASSSRPRTQSEERYADESISAS